MPFLPSNQQRQSIEGKNKKTELKTKKQLAKEFPVCERSLEENQVSSSSAKPVKRIEDKSDTSEFKTCMCQSSKSIEIRHSKWEDCGSHEF